MKKVLCICFAAFMIIISTNCSFVYAKNKTIVWRMNSSFTSQGFIADAFNFFADEVKKRSDGNLIIEIYFNSSLGFKNTVALSTLKKNIVEISELMPGPMDSEECLSGLVNLPFLHADANKAIDWQINDFGPVLNKALVTKWNSQLIGFVPLPAPIEFFSKNPIETLDDLQGLKIRTWGGIPGDALDALGAKPFTITTSELYTALQRGMVDAAITSYVSASESHFWEVLNYINHIVLSNQMIFIGVNASALNNLSDELKKAVLDSGDATTMWAKTNLASYSNKLKKMLLDGGMKEVWPKCGELEKMKAKCEPIYKTFVDKICPESAPLLRELGAIN